MTEKNTVKELIAECNEDGRANLIMFIIRLLNLADDEALSNIYYFVLHRIDTRGENNESQI